MANIQPTNTVSIETELGTLEQYKYNPSAIVQVTFNRLQDMLDGKVTLLEPSTPFAYLLETTAMNTAFAVQEFALLTRKLYPRLANTDEDLYLHMSDYDYVGRFSEPSTAKVVFNIMFNDFKTKANYDATTKDYTFKLPRHLKVLVGNYVYLLTSAIVIRLSSNNVVDVRFENQDFNNILPVDTTHINFFIKSVNQEEQYVSFELELPEIDIEVNDMPVDMTALFKGELNYSLTRQFYLMRAFFFKDNEWVEMLVTHTNEVYDINTPTCIIKVLTTDHKLQYSVPSVYLNTGAVTGKIRILIYTTTGLSNVSFGDFKLDEFNVEYGDVFPETELDKYTTPLKSITKIVYIQNNITNGKDGLTFDQLKSAVIDNSIGDRKLPITSKQLEFSSGQNNFKIIKDVDIVTNRVYKLETQLPVPKNRYPVTKYNLDIIEVKSKISDIRDGNGTSEFGDNITAIPQGTIFKLESGRVIQLTQPEADRLKQLSGVGLVTEVNNNVFLSLYYHYVLDTGLGRTSLRPYDLSSPLVKSSSFRTFNSTAKVGINTVTSNLYKTPTGYTLDVLSNLKKFTNTITEANVRPYLVHTDVSGGLYYLKGNLFTVTSEQPIYRFNLETDYFIDVDNRIHFKNFLDSNGLAVPVFVDLEASLELIYVSDSVPTGYVASDMDSYITSSYIAGNKCAVTLEDLKLVFGNYLEHLFATVHTSTGTFEYEVHSEDVPLFYTKTVYNADNTILHSVGEPVLDGDGEQVIEFHKGDVKLDSSGNTAPITTLDLQRYLNLLFIDYRVTLCNATIYKDYNTQIRKHITQVCLNDAVKVQEQLLDNSQGFVVIPKTVGNVTVKTATGASSMLSAQKFSLSVFVHYDVFNDADVRDNITYAVIKTIDEYLLANNTLKKTEILNELYVSLKDFIVSIGFDLFTEINSEYIQITDENSRISIDKLLTISSTGYELKENIDVNFKMVD